MEFTIEPVSTQSFRRINIRFVALTKNLRLLLTPGPLHCASGGDRRSEIMPDPFHMFAESRSLAHGAVAEALPPATTLRWNAKRKAEVVRAIEAGTLTYDEACRRYRMFLEELLGWQRALEESGERGLRVTRRIRPQWVDPFDWHKLDSVHRKDRHDRSH
jgi:hypothetical protein